MSKQLDEIIELGGLVELTSPLMLFVDRNELDAEGKPTYAIIFVNTKSILRILEVKDNGVYGEIEVSSEAVGLKQNQEVGRVSDLTGKRFVTSTRDLEGAIYTRDLDKPKD